MHTKTLQAYSRIKDEKIRAAKIKTAEEHAAQLAKHPRNPTRVLSERRSAPRARHLAPPPPAPTEEHAEPSPGPPTPPPEPPTL